MHTTSSRSGGVGWREYIYYLLSAASGQAGIQKRTTYHLTYSWIDPDWYDIARLAIRFTQVKVNISTSSVGDLLFAHVRQQSIASASSIRIHV